MGFPKLSARPAVQLLLGCCLLLLTLSACPSTATAHDGAAVVLHTSLVSLLNAEQSQWTVQLRSASGTDTPRGEWTAMREAWVEGQPMENAAALLFALPPPPASLYLDDEEATEDEEDAVTRAQRRQLFGHAALSFHGLSCEEYGAAGSAATGTLQGRCYLMRDSGADVFFNYRVDTSAAAGGAATKSAAAARRRRAGQAAEAEGSAASKDAASTLPQTSSSSATAKAAAAPHVITHASAGSVWREFVVLPGAESGVVGTDGDVRVGDLRIAENVTQARDAVDSTRVHLRVSVTLEETGPAGSTAKGAPVTTELLLTGVTGAYCEQAVRHASMEVQASRTSVYNRFVFPVVYIGSLYGLVYGAVWMQARRSSAAAAGGAPAAKKQQ